MRITVLAYLFYIAAVPGGVEIEVASSIAAGAVVLGFTVRRRSALRWSLIPWWLSAFVTGLFLVAQTISVHTPHPAGAAFDELVTVWLGLLTAGVMAWVLSGLVARTDPARSGAGAASSVLFMHLRRASGSLRLRASDAPRLPGRLADWILAKRRIELIVTTLTVMAGIYFWHAYGFSGFMQQLQNVAIVATTIVPAAWIRKERAWRRTPLVRRIAIKLQDIDGDPAEAARLIAEDDGDGPAQIARLFLACAYGAHLAGQRIPVESGGAFDLVAKLGHGFQDNGFAGVKAAAAELDHVKRAQVLHALINYEVYVLRIDPIQSLGIDLTEDMVRWPTGES